MQKIALVRSDCLRIGRGQLSDQQLCLEQASARLEHTQLWPHRGPNATVTGSIRSQLEAERQRGAAPRSGWFAARRR